MEFTKYLVALTALIALTQAVPLVYPDQLDFNNPDQVVPVTTNPPCPDYDGSSIDCVNNPNELHAHPSSRKYFIQCQEKNDGTYDRICQTCAPIDTYYNPNCYQCMSEELKDTEGKY